MKIVDIMNEIPKINFTFSEEEEARWLCLIERINYISDRIDLLDEAELDFNNKKIARTIHKALCKYIDERFNAMLWDVRCANLKKQTI